MPVQFQRACLEQINYMPPRLKEADWQAVINAALEKCTEIEVPPELTKRGIFVSILEDFCTGRVQAQSAEEMSLGKPWTEEGKTYFKLQALLDYMKTKGFFEYTRGQTALGKRCGSGLYLSSKVEKLTYLMWRLRQKRYRFD